MTGAARELSGPKGVGDRVRKSFVRRPTSHAVDLSMMGWQLQDSNLLAQAVFLDSGRGAIEQVPTTAGFTNPGSELMTDIIEELEIVESIAEAHNPALNGDSGDEEEHEPPISNCEALQHLHALTRDKEAQAWVKVGRVLLRLLRTCEREISARHWERASKQAS
ncbi:hypothetical protein BJ878DRAFT_541089 [Calycina marina]|uniref:Uncharacterized protein n=1 Tax=Calycina marina TaxID=1763456 RepID=A0A9P7Z5A0_9HELO|nr:hypothetical protein BJ878DRAFT_541089 [Calycina marina]